MLVWCLCLKRYGMLLKHYFQFYCSISMYWRHHSVEIQCADSVMIQCVVNKFEFWIRKTYSYNAILISFWRLCYGFVIVQTSIIKMSSWGRRMLNAALKKTIQPYGEKNRSESNIYHWLKSTELHLGTEPSKRTKGGRMTHAS